MLHLYLLTYQPHNRDHRGAKNDYYFKYLRVSSLKICVILAKKMVIKFNAPGVLCLNGTYQKLCITFVHPSLASVKNVSTPKRSLAKLDGKFPEMIKLDPPLKSSLNLNSGH